MPDAVYGRHVFTIDLLWLKNAPKWIPYDALGDHLKHFFVQHYRPKMDAVYNRHVLGTKTCLSWSGNAPEMGAMWQRLPQFSMLNPFLLLKQNAPQIDAFYVKVVFWLFFPTCQVRVVRFYVSCLLLSSSSPPLLLSSSPLLVSSPLLLSSPPPPAQPRPSTHSGLCRTSTTTIHAQCSLPDLNHDHHRQCSLPDLNRGYPRPVFPAGPQPRPSTPSVPCRTSTASIHAKCSLPDLM